MEWEKPKIYVVFSISQSPFKRILGKIIEWIDGVPFTHASILVDDGYTQVMFESVIPKSQKLPIDKWRIHYKAQYMYRLPDTNFEMAKFYLDRMMGKDYSISQLILIAIARGCRKFQRYFGNNINGAKRLICSELVAEFLILSYGIDFKEAEDFVSLNDVWSVVKILNRRRWEA